MQGSGTQIVNSSSYAFFWCSTARWGSGVGWVMRTKCKQLRGAKSVHVILTKTMRTNEMSLNLLWCAGVLEGQTKVEKMRCFHLRLVVVDRSYCIAGPKWRSCLSSKYFLGTFDMKGSP